MKKLALSLFCASFLAVFSACTKADSANPSAPAEASKPMSSAPAETTASAKSKTDELHKKPLMTFTGKLLDGTPFNSDDYVGDKIVFAFFSYKNKDALPMLTTLTKLKEKEVTNQFKIVAVSINSGKSDEVKSFVTANKIEFPVVLENDALELATKLGIENEVALVGLNNRHQPAFGIRQYVFASMANGESQFLDYMRENLNIRTIQPTKPILGIHPVAPDFTAKTLDGKEFKLSDHKGHVVLVLFFSPKCPHCLAEIKFMREKLYPELHKDGFEIVAVSVFELEGDMLKTVQSLNMPWPIVDDHDRAIRLKYSGELGVPENFFVDQEGRIRYTSVGYAETSEDLQLMRARHLLGVNNPILLSDKRFNGADTCMVCHEAEHASWQATPHAHAFETLQIKGEDTNPECVGCHSIGMGDPHGWKPVTDAQGQQIARVPELFQNVQCEHCHGLGGPHKSEPRKAADMKKTCLECHTETFSLHFNFDERIHKVDHGDIQKLMAMSDSDRLALLTKVSKRPEDLFGSETKYVGSTACLSCHADTHKNWLASAHGQGAKKDFSQPGPDQDNIHKEAVGATCESCHGPGEKHVASKNKQYIRGLGEDCPFCVIEQICMSCHTPKNDPEFNLVKDLDKIKGHQ
jgi:peroxiredoxin